MPVADPLPQALVLTAIVIGFAMTALLLVLALRTHADSGSDHVEGENPRVGKANHEPASADVAPDEGPKSP
jgi:TRAP-type C4-dicarboxylate transport system permease small subunit